MLPWHGGRYIDTLIFTIKALQFRQTVKVTFNQQHICDETTMNVRVMSAAAKQLSFKCSAEGSIRVVCLLLDILQF